MKRFIEGDARGQGTLLPELLDDYVAENNPVRVVNVFVDELDLGELGFEGVGPITGRSEGLIAPPPRQEPLFMRSFRRKALDHKKTTVTKGLVAITFFTPPRIRKASDTAEDEGKASEPRRISSAVCIDPVFDV